MSARTLQRMYARLYRAAGPRRWWPADSPQEVIVGAILTQSIAWKNVEQAITNLREAGCLSFRAIQSMPAHELAALIRPARFLNQKTRALKEFADYFGRRYDFSIRQMAARDTGELRVELLGLYRIGAETADSILLYALAKPVFVIDLYTKRILSRHGMLSMEHPYEDFQRFCTDAVAPDVQLYNEFHALLVYAGNAYCGTKPRCDACPLKGV
jgi:endonuclease III related protein